MDDMRELVDPEPEMVADFVTRKQAVVDAIRERDEADRKRQEAANGCK